MKENFIKKLETENYYIGSFDAYIEESKAMIKNNGNFSDEEVDKTLGMLPTTYRATILDKNGEYIGYISIYNTDVKNGTCSIRLETIKELEDLPKNEIISEYKNWCEKSLNFSVFEEEVIINPKKTEKKAQSVIKTNVVIPKDYLKEGIDDPTLSYMKQFYNIPNLQMPFTIVDNGRVIGIVGLTNLIWSTKRAQLQIFLNKDIDDELAHQLGSVIIDDYLSYLHNLGLHNITTSASSFNKQENEMINETNFSMWADIPFSSIKDGKIGSKIMYQDVPGYEKRNGLYVPNSNVYDIGNLNNAKEQRADVIYIDKEHRLVSPSVFESQGIDINPIIKEYANCLEQREIFSKPLGEDKYVPQIGNGKYGLSKAVSNFTYVLLNENNGFCGFVNNLRDDKENGNMEIELAINPRIHSKGLGTKMLTAFYDEMFSLGYTSITSGVFSFNEKSLNLHQKVASFNGIRIESYYINGKYYDMNYFTKINPMFDDEDMNHKQR